MTFLANGLAPIWYINLSTTCEIIRVFTIKMDECDQERPIWKALAWHNNTLTHHLRIHYFRQPVW